MSLVHALLAAGTISVNDTGQVSGGGFYNGSLGSVFGVITNTLIYLVGAISVIMVIVGGFRYVMSSGNPQDTKAAKDTILYAIIGLVVAILGYAIVHFVLHSFKLV